MTIAEQIYQTIVDVLFGNITGNEWYTAHLDAIRGITTVVLCAVVLFIVVWLVVSVIRFLGSIIDFRR